MASNIRFEIHEGGILQLVRDNNERGIGQRGEYNTILTEAALNNFGPSNATDALFSILAAARMVDGMGGSDPLLEQAVQASLRDQCDLEKDKDRKISVSQQRYDTTDQAFVECSICCDQYDNNDTLVSVLECGHVFHPVCITEWGHYNPICPICKRDILIL
jgi:hypothetical protein